MFLAAEALLLGGCNDNAIHNQGGSSIHALANAIFAIVEAGPMRLFERNGIFQPADSKYLHNLPLVRGKREEPLLVAYLRGNAVFSVSSIVTQSLLQLNQRSHKTGYNK